MTRVEYFQKQKELTKAAARAETEAARRIRAVTRELVLPLARQYLEQGNVVFPKEELSKKIDRIIREEGAKPVQEARKLQEGMEAFLAEKLDIKLRPRSAVQENQREKARLVRANAAKKPVGSIIKIQGQGWGYGTTAASAYRRDPDTGNVVWTDLPLEYQFRKRADLSTQVWKAVEGQEQAVFDVIQGGRAAGRNVRDIARDLEEYINYPNGGERVVGRWMGMFPNTESGRREAWQREYLAAHGNPQPGTDAAKALLQQSDAKDWVRQKMEETTKRGTPRLPDAVKQYASRLGKAGLDYRAIRIARTETAAMLSDEQKDIAQNSSIADGKMDFVMDRGRDHWGCRCEELAAGGPYDVNNLVDAEGNDIDIPIHPNCVPAGTKIETPNGQQNIEGLSTGDCVIGYSGKFRRVSKVYNTPYVGELFSINAGLANFTFNHPVFVYGRGWCEAQSLKKGDCLISAESMFKCPDGKDSPAVIFKKLPLRCILRYLLWGSVPAAAVNFNGNHLAGNCYVDVIYPNGKKRGCFYAIVSEELIKNNFVNRKMLFFLNSSSTFFFVIKRTLFAANRIMRGFCSLILKLFGSNSIKGAAGLGSGFEREASLDEAKSQGIPANANGVCEAKQTAVIRHKCRMNFFNVIHRFRLLFSHKPVYHTVIVNSIEKHITNENVYNLTVEHENAYFANGILTHNCMCEWRPHLKSDEEIMAAWRADKQGQEDLETIKKWQEEGEENLASAKKEFPNEKWTQEINGEEIKGIGGFYFGTNIHVAESRIPQETDKQHQKWKDFRKELEQSQFLESKGHSVVLLPEKGKPIGERYVDAMVDGKLTELKRVTGSKDKIWDKFRDAREKTPDQIDVFLEINSKKIKTVEYVKDTLRNRIRQYNNEGGKILDGLIYLKFGENGELETWQVKDLIK